MDYIVPPINLTGRFKLKAPLDKLINVNVPYKVVKISSIKTLLDELIDVKTLVYKDQGLSTDKYLAALEKNIPIVTLETEGGAQINVPADYISYMPHISGKIFINKAIIINLGYIPKELNVEYILEDLKDYIKNSLGIENQVSLEEISGKRLVSYSDYNAYERKRLANITNKNTCRGNLEKMTNLLKTYKEKLKVLIKKLEKCKCI